MPEAATLVAEHALAQEGAVFEWRLPRGFPPPRVPADNPMSAVKVELGRRLFFDTRLSGNGTLSCAGCHRPELAFTDGRPRAVGATGERHPRSAMSLANVAYNARLTWADPALDSLEEQALVPMLSVHPVEMGVRGREGEILERLRWDAAYPALFAKSFPGETRPLILANVARAIAAFERTLISGNSSYDRLLWEDDGQALSVGAKRGMRLFFSERMGCVACHGSFNFSGPILHGGEPPPGPDLAPKDGGEGAVPAFHNTGLYNLGNEGDYPPENRGLFVHTGEARDMGRFRAPTLRNVAVTAPYMHDGSISTLAEVLEHYAAGGRTLEHGPHAGVGSKNPWKSEKVQGFVLAPGEKEDLLAFLNCLTDETFLTDPRFQDPWEGNLP